MRDENGRTRFPDLSMVDDDSLRHVAMTWREMANRWASERDETQDVRDAVMAALGTSVADALDELLEARIVAELDRDRP